MASREQTLITMFLVALAFTSSSFTFLSIGALPISLLEVVLVAAMLLHLPLGGGFHRSGATSMFPLAVWVLVAATLPGLAMTWQLEGMLPGVVYNLIALAWIVVLVAYLTYGFEYEHEELEWLCLAVLALSVLYFVTCLALGATLPAMLDGSGQLLELDFTFEAVEAGVSGPQRLSGLSNGPQLLGLHALVALFFCINFWRQIGTGTAFFSLAVILYAGYLTRSDAFVLGAAIMVLLAVVPQLVSRSSFHTALARLLMLALACAVVFFLIANDEAWLLALQEQAVARPVLWQNALLALLKSPLVGWGPGAWSGMTGPLGLREADSSLIDYLASAGILGLLVLGCSLLVLVFATAQTRQPELIGGLAGMLVFALLHNVLREPLLWLVLFYIANNVRSPLGEAGVTTQTRRRRQRARH